MEDPSDWVNHNHGQFISMMTEVCGDVKALSLSLADTFTGSGENERVWVGRADPNGDGFAERQAARGTGGCEKHRGLDIRGSHGARGGKERGMA